MYVTDVRKLNFIMKSNISEYTVPLILFQSAIEQLASIIIIYN